MRALTAWLFLCASLAGAQHDTLTVLTYNIRYDNPADGPDRWDLRKEALARVVREQRPTVIGLQECLAHQLTYLDAQWPGLQRVGVGRDDGVEAGEFSPVYYDTTRLALAAFRTLWLSPTPDSPGKGWDAACTRIATLAVLVDRRHGDSLWVVNTHWDHVGMEARHHSARMVLDLVHVPLSMGQEVVVMGDLNATADEEPVRQLGQYLLNTCPEAQRDRGTYNGFGKASAPMPRIDHVFISPTRWRVTRELVLEPKVNGREVSDHFPVVVDLVR